MKQTARKLLSLLMAFAIVLSLAPWALAVDAVHPSGRLDATKTEINAGEATQITPKLEGGNLQSPAITSVVWTIDSDMVEHNLPAGMTSSADTPITITAKENIPKDTQVNITATIDYTYTTAEAEGEASRTESSHTTASISILVKAVPDTTAAEISFDKTSPMEMTVGGTPVNVIVTVRNARGEPIEGKTVTLTQRGNSATASLASTTTNSNGQVTMTVTPSSTTDGDTTCTISADSRNGTFEVKVKPQAVPATNIYMHASNPSTMRVGEAGVTFRAVLYPTGSTGTVVWASSDATVAAIDSTTGVVTAKKAGQVTISASLVGTVGSQPIDTATATLTVTGTSVYLSFNQSDVSLAVGERKSVSVTVHGMTPQEMGANNYIVRMRPVDGVLDKISPYGDLTSVTSGSDTVITWRFDGAAVGSERLYAQLLDRNGNPVTGVSTVYCDVTVTGSSNFTLSDNLTLANTSTATSYGLMRAYLSSVSAADLRNYSVRWTSSNPSVAFFHSSDSISANQGTAVTAFSGTTSSSAYNSDITIYAGTYSGTATITAQLYYGNTPVSGSTVTRTVTVGTAGLTLVPTPSNTSAVYLDEYWGSTTSGYYRDFSVDPRLNGSSIQSTSSSRPYDVYYTWTLNGYTMNSTSNSNSYRLYSNNQYLNRYTSATTRYNTLVCSVAVYARGTQVTSSTRPLYSNSVTWNVYTGTGSSRFSVSATVYDSNPGYALTDTPDEGNTGSIASQIDTWVRNNYYYGSTSTGYYRDYQVHITGGTAYESGSSGNRGTLTSASSSTWYSYSDLDRVVFTPGSYVSTSTGSYQISYGFEVRLYNYSGSTVSDTVYGTMIFTVKQGAASGGDIAYSGERGKDVSFDVSDFERFWTKRYSGGSLTSVTFGTPTGTPGGTVYDSSSRAVGSRDFYVNPSRSENDLNGVYFSPKSSTAGTTRIPFTATGRTRSNSSSTAATLRGTIVITYLSSAANKITYVTASNGTVNLKASDFTSAYRQVTGNTAPSNLTIVFQDVPANGTLTYTDSSRSSATAVRLTSSNIRSRNFTTKSSGSNQLEDVTYTGSNGRSDTISYIAYSGTNAVFTGEVTFNAITTPMDVNVYYTCYAAAGIPLTPANFTSANSAMSNASYVILGTPRTGKLTYNAGPANAAILMTLLGGVTYTPSTATTGTSYTDSFTFRAFNAANTLVASGTVNVTVSLPANTVKPGAITNINQLTDIPAPGVASDWYRPQLTFLINKGVINGKGEGKFGPGDDLAYSEALKFIMNAAGYYETELTGANWAQNYRNRAVQSGWLSSDVNINSKITRDAMAELTAKVLGIPASTNANPFADSTNQWAAALYEKKIVQGTTSGARPNFSGNTMLKRSEMVCLVYNMYQYSGK